MKFVTSSAELLGHLQSASKVINTKNTLPILDNFLFKLDGNILEITASDLETTLVTRMVLENVSESGAIAIPARTITEFAGKFADQPLTFNVDVATHTIRIYSENGEYTIQGYPWDDFPQLPQLKTDMAKPMHVPAGVALQGVSKTIFATGDDELRPVMNGIFVELTTDSITFVASDSHMLVRYRRTDVKAEENGSFILSKKPASLLRTLLAKEQSDVEISFDDRNARFRLSDYTLICRLVEGIYPAYNSVIPTNNPNKMTIDRVEFLSSLRRLQMFANQATNLVKMELKGNQVKILAQNLDFSSAGDEVLKCQYDGDNMTIGFKVNFLSELVSNLSSTDILMEMSDPARAILVLPVQTDTEGEDILMLIMPMTVAE
ncbi:MAG: DNA polymerase III subunit beta [Bacteroidales bacterium]|jgi:DNA polymerase-3 subunit beta|nr:DNA polymerase III subunit beta [Bacteroidales bacterium]